MEVVRTVSIAVRQKQLSLCRTESHMECLILHHFQNHCVLGTVQGDLHTLFDVFWGWSSINKKPSILLA